MAHLIEKHTQAAASIRTEHAQRLTLQHHAADLAQRVADLEAKCDTLKHLHDAAADERDELRARLAELGQQEPVAVSVVATVGRAKDGLHLRWLIEGGLEGLECGCTLLVADRRISGDDGSGEVYARPAPAIPPGWKLVPVEPTDAMLGAGLRHDHD